ncbi:hypothetical protein EV191_105193 [Tamaricihabitans halophyticus]|uniref:Uncharacterized protein n=1 Tax=Tamaricihabitans halophyticus TaxID=1262583 RepID=A0A4R2QT81_9PSEU|nr:hypothetical protein [Tamaricihabitans halophyticus]TCP53130.1 hypothetical protein EV191_105193 [Tamaricihabitans halophyticus]
MRPAKAADQRPRLRLVAALLAAAAASFALAFGASTASAADQPSTTEHTLASGTLTW